MPYSVLSLLGLGLRVAATGSMGQKRNLEFKDFVLKFESSDFVVLYMCIISFFLKKKIYG